MKIFIAILILLFSCTASANDYWKNVCEKYYLEVFSEGHDPMRVLWWIAWAGEKRDMTLKDLNIKCDEALPGKYNFSQHNR